MPTCKTGHHPTANGSQARHIPQRKKTRLGTDGHAEFVSNCQHAVGKGNVSRLKYYSTYNKILIGDICFERQTTLDHIRSHILGDCKQKPQPPDCRNDVGTNRSQSATVGRPGPGSLNATSGRARKRPDKEGNITNNTQEKLKRRREKQPEDNNGKVPPNFSTSAYQNSGQKSEYVTSNRNNSSFYNQATANFSSSNSVPLSHRPSMVVGRRADASSQNSLLGPDQIDMLLGLAVSNYSGSDMVGCCKLALQCSPMDTIIRSYLVAVKYRLCDVMDSLIHSIRLNFPSIAQTKEFLSLPLDFALIFMEDSCLNVENELDMFVIALTWIDFNKQQRLPQAGRMLKSVRYAHMDPVEIALYVEPNSHLFTGPDGAEALVNLYKHHVCGQSFRFPPGLNDKIPPKRRMPRMPDKTHIVSESTASRMAEHRATAGMHAAADVHPDNVGQTSARMAQQEPSAKVAQQEPSAKVAQQETSAKVAQQETSALPKEQPDMPVKTRVSFNPTISFSDLTVQRDSKGLPDDPNKSSNLYRIPGQANSRGSGAPRVLPYRVYNDAYRLPAANDAPARNVRGSLSSLAVSQDSYKNVHNRSDTYESLDNKYTYIEGNPSLYKRQEHRKGFVPLKTTRGQIRQGKGHTATEWGQIEYDREQDVYHRGQPRKQVFKITRDMSGPVINLVYSDSDSPYSS